MSEQHSLGEWQPDRNLAMELVRATEAAAIRSGEGVTIFGAAIRSPVTSPRTTSPGRVRAT